MTGIAWYRREEWPRLLAESTDRQRLEDTYEEWLAAAELTVKRLRAQGIELLKVDVGMEDLLEWCRTEGRPVDGTARACYATWKLQHSR